MKILTAEQTRSADQFTIENEPIQSIDLMERACEAFVNKFITIIEPTQSIAVISGPGNNGGDGLGIARMLDEKGFEVKTYLFSSKKLSEDCQTNLNRLKTSLSPTIIDKESFDDLTIQSEVIIDAIFGSGLSRKPEGLYADVIEDINSSNAVVVAVDIPSGLFADSHSEGTIIKADYTLSFQLPKLAFYMAENEDYVGDWRVVPIGLDENFIEKQDTCFHQTDRNYIFNKISPLSRFSHKGKRGHVLIVGASKGKAGAVILASQAALKSGCGLLTVRVPDRCMDAVQSAFPEAMCLADDNEDFLSGEFNFTDFDALAIGPGMGTDPLTANLLKKILEDCENPVVLDADSLNIISKKPEMLALGNQNWILTPHPGEFKRLFGEWKDDFEKIELQRKMSQKFSVNIVLKGAFTSVCDPDGNIYFNPTGNPGMATAGSGDTLTGIIASLAAQGFQPLDAARIGVFLHGLSGDLASEYKGEHSIIASDLIDHLPEAFQHLINY